MANEPVDAPGFRLSQVFQETPDAPQQLGITDPSQAPQKQDIGGAVGALGNYFQYKKDQQVISDAEKNVAIKYDSSKPTTTFEVPTNLVPYYQQAIKGYGDIQQNYNKMLMVNQARQAQLQAHPWANTLATIAGSLAANDPNPITRGLGQAAQQLNPTQQQLQAQQMQILQGQGQAEGQGLQAAEGYTRTQELLRSHQMAETQKTQALTEKRVEKALGELQKVAMKGGGPLTPEQFAAGMKARGINDPEQIANAYQEHTGGAQAAIAGLSGEQKRKIEIMNDKSTIDQQRDQFKAGVQLQVARMHQISADKALTIRQGEMNDRAAASREMRGYGKVEKDVMAAIQTVEGSQHLRQKIEDLKTIAGPEYVGVIEGRIPVDKLPLDDATKRRVGELRAEFFTMMNDVKNSFGAGARFWNPQEFANLSPKLASAIKSNATNLGILDAIDASAIRTARKLVQSNQDVDWETRQSAFGNLAPQVMEGQRMGGLQGKAGGTSQMKPQPVGGAPAAAPAGGDAMAQVTQAMQGAKEGEERQIGKYAFKMVGGHAVRTK